MYFYLYCLRIGRSKVIVTYYLILRVMTHARRRSAAARRYPCDFDLTTYYYPSRCKSNAQRFFLVVAARGRRSSAGSSGRRSSFNQATV